MRLDIYRRPDPDGKISYLAVPEGREIPAEATNTDWVIEARRVDVDDDADSIPEYEIDHLQSQLDEKRYAVTSVFH